MGALPRDCLVTDVSDGGARLHVEGCEVPQRFILWLTPNDRRECQMAWRLGHEIGVQFVDAHQAGFGTRIAGAVDKLELSGAR